MRYEDLSLHPRYVNLLDIAYGQWRRQVFKSGGGGGLISDFKKNTENILRTNARERSDQARGSEATERGEGVGGGCRPSHGREIFQFWGSESCNLVHAVMRFLTLHLIRIWIKIIPYSRTHTETGSEYKKIKINKN